jgi:hypothetical protein
MPTKSRRQRRQRTTPDKLEEPAVISPVYTAKRTEETSSESPRPSSSSSSSLSPLLSDPCAFPGMSVLCHLAHNTRKLCEVLSACQGAVQAEERGRLNRLLAAEWTPSTSRDFELLTGRVPGCVYYLFCRTNRSSCNDLCGGFAAVLQAGKEDSHRSQDVALLLPLPKVRDERSA